MKLKKVVVADFVDVKLTNGALYDEAVSGLSVKFIACNAVLEVK